MTSITWEHFTALFLSLHEPPMRAPATYRQIRQILRELPCKRTSDLTEETIAAWLKAHPERSAARIASLLRTLAPAAKFLVRRGYLRSNPFDFRPPSHWIRPDARGGTRPRRSKSPSEIGRILDQANMEALDCSWQTGRLQALVHLFAYTGLRKQEALTLRVEDIDLERRELTIRPKDDWQPKTVRSSARLPIPKPLVAVLRLWLPRCGGVWVFPGTKQFGPWVGGMPGSNALDQVRALGVRAGVDGLTMDGFRKTLGTQAKRWGISQLGVMRLLRHTSVATQDFYDEEDLEALDHEAEKITYPRLTRAT